MTDNDGPWCHTCDLPITEDQEIMTPNEAEPWEGFTMQTVGCLRCLTFPVDDGAKDAG